MIIIISGWMVLASSTVVLTLYTPPLPQLAARCRMNVEEAERTWHNRTNSDLEQIGANGSKLGVPETVRNASKFWSKSDSCSTFALSKTRGPGCHVWKGTRRRKEGQSGSTWLTVFVYIQISIPYPIHVVGQMGSNCTSITNDVSRFSWLYLKDIANICE
jgi:hypothetical protein